MTTTLRDALRAADRMRSTPLRDGERAAMRQTVLAARSSLPAPARRRVLPRHRAIAIAALLAIACVLAGTRFWPRGATTVQAAVRFEARLAEPVAGAGLVEAPVAGHAARTYLRQSTVVSNGDVADARVVDGADADHFSVMVVFTSEGARKMREATESHLGEPLAILIDGEVVVAPVLRSPIDETAIISGNFVRPEAERIAAGIVRF